MTLPLILSRPIRIAAVSGATRLTVVATAEERAALAEAHGLESVTSLEARLVLTREGKEAMRVAGTVSAKLVYRCVVTLEPVPGEIAEDIDMRFADLPPTPTDGEFSLEAEDPPEPAPGGVADVGAIVAEFFALGLDPYPRAPGAELPETGDAAPEAGPFAALARLKGSPEGG